MPKKISKQSKKEAKKKGATIDDLALMVKKGFDGQNQRFDKIEKRLDGHDKKFILLETNLNISREDFNESKETLNRVYDSIAILK